MTARGRTAVVGVHPAPVLADYGRLFAGIEASMPVRFVARRGPQDDQACDGVVVVGEDELPTMAWLEALGVPAIAFAGLGVRQGPQEEVRLLDDEEIDRRLREVRLPTATVGRPLAPVAARDALAVGRSGPAWTRRRGPVGVDRVRAALPVLDDDEVLRDGLRQGRALALVALVSFLRQLAPDDWDGPGLRAAFVFDDPNLRRRTYGHIDFRRLVAHGDEHRYHAAMAMVPLDGVRAHPVAVRTFRARPDRLSVVMHGNDHTRDELLRPRDERAALALGAQALRRIEAFERVNGMPVDRVMMPPHGLCSRVVAQALGRLGYDALCAIHPSPWTERPTSERLLAGWMPADFVDGCTVIPRFPLSCATYEIALRAFLGQPLVLYGHHGDVAGGLDPLAQAAARINGLGPVRWCSLGEIVRGNHQLRMEGTVAVVRPWTSRMELALPEGATEVAIQAPPGGVATGLCGWTISSRDDRPVPFGSSRPLDPSPDGRRLVVRLCGQVPTDPRSVADPRGRAWPLLRRRATEARDRLAPHTRRWNLHRVAPGPT